MLIKKIKENKIKEEKEVNKLWQDYYNEKNKINKLINKVEDKNVKEILSILVSRFYR